MKYLFIIAAIFLSYAGLAKDKVFTKNGVAIDGYDTVSYFTKGTAAKGNKSMFLLNIMASLGILTPQKPSNFLKLIQKNICPSMVVGVHMV